MTDLEPIYIVGAGAIGSALAVQLSAHGRRVTAVRTSQRGLPPGWQTIRVRDAAGDELSASIDTVSLDLLPELHGLIVISAKSYANDALAAALADKKVTSPIVVLQNGLGVEDRFISAGFRDVYRCVLFATSERLVDGRYAFRSIKPSPVGVIEGSAAVLRRVVKALDTPAFPFAEDDRIQETIWQKAIINAVFNSICPLLDVDNGIFDRDERARALAADIVGEGVAVAGARGLPLDRDRVLQQLLAISHAATGQAISTLQDIRRGNPTEIASLNLAIARMGDEASPSVRAERTRVLGRMVELKAALRREGVGPER